MKCVKPLPVPVETTIQKKVKIIGFVDKYFDFILQLLSSGETWNTVYITLSKYPHCPDQGTLKKYYRLEYVRRQVGTKVTQKQVKLYRKDSIECTSA